MRAGIFLLSIFSVLLSYSFSAYGSTLSKTQIGGHYYNQIIQVKDVIADVLPPPGYIVESYLAIFLLLDEVERAMSDKKIDHDEMKRIDQLAEYLRQLKEGVSGEDDIEGYFSRIDIWKSDLSDTDLKEKELKELMTKEAVMPAKDFYQIVESKFIPAIKKGNVLEAKKLLKDLRESFNRHRAVITKVVDLARSEVTSLEAEALKNKNSDLVKLKGVLYNKILLMKDLISDILPPPSFIIESYLHAWEMIYEVEDSGSSKASHYTALKNEGKELSKTYGNRHEFWEKNLKFKDLKTILTKTSYEPAINFYKNYETGFLPSLEKGDLVMTKKVMREKLRPLFEEHRKNIDKLVLVADKRAIAIESTIARALSKK